LALRMILQLCFEISPICLCITGGAFFFFYLKKGPPWLIMISLLFLALGFLLIYAIYIVPKRLKVYEVSFRLNASSESPSYRIVLFSDLHLGALKGRRWAKRVTETTNKADPDLILIGGDFVFQADPQKLKSYLEPLKALKAREGVYAVLGNHDYGVPGEDLSSQLEVALAELGILVLHNQSVELQKFVLVGVDEVWAGKSSLKKAFLQVKQGKPVISLCHNPDIFLNPSNSEGINAFHAGLWLLGHTHNGQVRLPLLGPVFLPTKTGMEWGFYDTPYGPAFVTQGAGESGAKIRFLTSPEVVVLKIGF